MATTSKAKEAAAKSGVKTRYMVLLEDTRRPGIWQEFGPFDASGAEGACRQLIKLEEIKNGRLVAVPARNFESALDVTTETRTTQTFFHRNLLDPKARMLAAADSGPSSEVEKPAAEDLDKTYFDGDGMERNALVDPCDRCDHARADHAGADDPAILAPGACRIAGCSCLRYDDGIPF
jgi:hypothetical protein